MDQPGSGGSRRSQGSAPAWHLSPTPPCLPTKTSPSLQGSPCKPTRTRSVACRTKELATVAGRKRVRLAYPYCSVDPSIYLCSSVQSAVRLVYAFPPYRVVFPDKLQAMGTLQARDALIVRRLAVNASSQNPPRCASILVQWLVINRFIPPDTRSSETVNALAIPPRYP